MRHATKKRDLAYVIGRIRGLEDALLVIDLIPGLAPHQRTDLFVAIRHEQMKLRGEQTALTRELYQKLGKLEEENAKTESK